MSRADGHVDDLEGATDQLVDEIWQRLAALFELVDTSLAEAGPSPHQIRRHAAATIYRLTNLGPASTAETIARTLWSTHSGAGVPAWWWATPLGQLLSRALETP